MPWTKIKSTNSESDIEMRNRDTFHLTDKVEYEDFVKKEIIPEEIIFPEELNRFLRDQIRELTAENGSLRRALDESEEKLLKLGKNCSHTDLASSHQLQPPIGGRASEIASSKIVELSKKCREQTAEVEILKSRCKKLERKLNENVNKIEEIKPPSDSGDGINSRPFTMEDELKNREEEIKSLQEKVQQINSKLYESKNACTLLRQELNKANKLLCREVGENVTIASFSSNHGNGGWRGRAEQIRQLQSKLSEYEGNLSKGSSATILEKRKNTTNLLKMEKERRLKAEESARELCEMNIALETWKRKHDAAKARVKVLENDATNAKQSILLLNEKRSHDEQLIHALNEQLKAVEDKFREREREILGIKERAENECMKMCSEVNRLQSVNENLRRTIEERETEIDSLRNAKETSKHYPVSRGGNMQCCINNTSPVITTRSNGDYNEYVTLGIAAEAERERLLELVIVLNRRLDEERFSVDKTGETLRAERMKLAKLETKLQRLEMERVGISKINNGYKTRSSKSALNISAGVRNGENVKDETRFRLELLEEECLALKTRLATVQRDKASDLAVYKQMLDQARKTFQDAYRGKPNSCSYSTVTI